MSTLLLEGFFDFAQGVSFDAPSAAANSIPFINNPTIIIAAIVLIAVTVFLLFFLKKVIVNSLLGGILWAVNVFIFHIELPLIPSFVIAILFGPAGIGAMMLLKFLGLMV